MSFLFISKLLPLFIYPVGLACLLLLLALWFCFKRSVWTFVPILLALIILVIAGNNQFSNQLLASLEHQYLPQAKLPQVEAIVVLGGATRNNEPPRIMPDMSDRGDRLLYGVKLYKAGLAPEIILTGGRIEWYGDGTSEAESMAVLMELMGVPRDAMVLESKALNTYENAVYVKQILEQKNIKQILLVTSAAHMPRSLAIFQHLKIDAIPAPTDFTVSDRNIVENQLSTQSRILGLIPAADNLSNTTQAIREYIGIFVYRLKGWL